MCSQLRGTLNNCSVLQRYKQVFSQSHCQEDKIIIIVQWQTPRFFLFTSSCFFTPEIDQEMSNSERGLYGCILHSSGFGLKFYENAIIGKTKCWSDGHRVGIMQRVMLKLLILRSGAESSLNQTLISLTEWAMSKGDICRPSPTAAPSFPWRPDWQRWRPAFGVSGRPNLCYFLEFHLYW